MIGSEDFILLGAKKIHANFLFRKPDGRFQISAESGICNEM